MTSKLTNVEVEEISILGKHSRPAVRGAVVVLAKSESAADFKKHVAAIRERDRCSGVEALQRARVEYPDDFAAYQASGAASSRPVVEKRAKPEAVITFEMLVDGIMERDKVKRTVAMERARREHPAAFDAYTKA